LIGQSQGGKNTHAARRKRGAARIKPRLVSIRGRRQGINQGNARVRVGAGAQQRQTGTSHAATTNGDMIIQLGAVDVSHGWVQSCPAISASMASAVLGSAWVSRSQPFLVINTSSSMRIPMPRHFLATSRLSGAT